MLEYEVRATKCKTVPQRKAFAGATGNGDQLP